MFSEENKNELNVSKEFKLHRHLKSEQERPERAQRFDTWIGEIEQKSWNELHVVKRKEENINSKVLRINIVY